MNSKEDQSNIEVLSFMKRYAAIPLLLGLSCTSSALELSVHEQYAAVEPPASNVTPEDIANYLATIQPLAIVSADFNGDGSPDIATANEGNNSVSILLNTNDDSGIPQTAQTINLSDTPVALLAVELNNPANGIDLIAVHRDSDTLSILSNTGSASFNVSTLSVGNKPVAITSADFDNDGNPDLAIVNRESAVLGQEPTITVLWGSGNATFSASNDYAVGQSPEHVTYGDFNNDGNLDLVVANNRAFSLSFLAGDGSRNFADANDTTLDFRPLSIQSGDFDGDNILDLAVIHIDKSRITILLGEDVLENDGAGDGNGDGTFSDLASYVVGNTPSELFVEDLDADGKLDLSIVHFDSDNLLILRGKGNGHFIVSEHYYAAGHGTIALTHADFNNDSYTDIASASYRSGKVSVIFGRGNARFATAMVRPINSTFKATTSGDFNNDSKLDIATLDSSNNQVLVRLRKHLNTFEATQIYATGTNPIAISSGKFDNNDTTDLAIANQDSASITVLLANTDGSFVSTNYDLASTGAVTPSDILSADVNVDGQPDLALTSASTNETILLRLQTTTAGEPAETLPMGTFEAAESFPTGAQPIALVSTDLNGDDRPDLTTANYDDENISVFINDPSATFKEPRTYAVDLPIRALLGGDFDRDNINDILVGLENTQQYLVFPGNNNGLLDDPKVFNIDFFPHRLTSGDFNGDGIPDIAATVLNSNFIMVWHGNGDGTFKPSRTLQFGSTIHSLATIDINEDGLSDLIASDASATRIYLFRSLGNGLFKAAGSYLTGSRPWDVLTLDHNQDGKLDIAVLNNGANRVSIFDGLGDGTFTSQVLTPSFGGSPVSLSSCDFNRDGYPDLLTATTVAETGSLIILLHDGSNSYLSPEKYAVGINPGYVQCADYDNDGLIDIAFADTADNTIQLVFAQEVEGSINYDATPLILPIGGKASMMSNLDINQDGLIDLIVSNTGLRETTILMNKSTTGAPLFEAAGLNYALGASPLFHIAADLNMDGGQDLIIAGRQISVALNSGNFQPEPFSVPEKTNVATSSPTQSAVISINGLASSANVHVSNGDYSIDGGEFKSTISSVSNGQSIIVRHTSAASADTTTQAILTVGSYSDAFKVTTVDDGTKPHAFSFEESINAPLSTATDSAPVTIDGLSSASNISIVGGTYAVNGGPFSSDPSQIVNQDSLVIRLLSSAEYQTITSATLTIGGVSNTFNVTTMPDTVPNGFSFAPVIDAGPNSRRVSAWTKIFGLTAPAKVSIKSDPDSPYARYDTISTESSFTLSDGFIENGQQIRVDIIAPPDFNSTREAILTIGGVSSTFSITTRENPNKEIQDSVADARNQIKEKSLFGCSLGQKQNNPIDPTLPALLFFALIALWSRRTRKEHP